MKLKRTPQKPWASSRRSSASAASGQQCNSAVRAVLRRDGIGRDIVVEAVQLDCTITQRAMPSIPCRANSASFGASAGAKGGSLRMKALPRPEHVAMRVAGAGRRRSAGFFGEASQKASLRHEFSADAQRREERDTMLYAAIVATSSTSCRSSNSARTRSNSASGTSMSRSWYR